MRQSYFFGGFMRRIFCEGCYMFADVSRFRRVDFAVSLWPVDFAPPP
jgi:hypothetical protein